MSRSLRELEAYFLRLEVHVEKRHRVRPEVWEVNQTGPYAETDFYEWEGPVDYLVTVDTIGEADGVRFLCPKCFDDPPVGPVGTHKVPEGHATLWLLPGATNLSQINFRQNPERGTGFDPSGYALDPNRWNSWLIHEMGVGGRSVLDLHGSLAAHLEFRTGVLATEFMVFEMLVEYVGGYAVPNRFKYRLATSTEEPKPLLSPSSC